MSESEHTRLQFIWLCCWCLFVFTLPTAPNCLARDIPTNAIGLHFSLRKCICHFSSFPSVACFSSSVLIFFVSFYDKSNPKTILHGRACVFVWIFATARCQFYFIDVLMLLLPTGRCCWVLLLLLTFCTFLASMDLFVFRSFLARRLLSVIKRAHTFQNKPLFICFSLQLAISQRAFTLKTHARARLHCHFFGDSDTVRRMRKTHKWKHSERLSEW